MIKHDFSRLRVGDLIDYVFLDYPQQTWWAVWLGPDTGDLLSIYWVSKQHAQLKRSFQVPRFRKIEVLAR